MSKLKAILVFGAIFLSSIFAYSQDCNEFANQPGVARALDQLAESGTREIQEASFCSASGVDGNSCADMFERCNPLLVDRINERVTQKNQAVQAPGNTQALQAIGDQGQAIASILFPTRYQALMAQKEKCQSTYKTARTACNPTQNETMSQVGQMAGQGIDAMGQLGPQAACTKMGGLLTKALAALGTFRLACGGLKARCQTNCNEAKNMASHIVSEIRECTGNIGAYNDSVLPYAPNLASLQSPLKEREACKIALNYFRAEELGRTPLAQDLKKAPIDKEVELTERQAKTEVTINSMTELCTGFEENLGRAMANGMQFMGMFMAAKQCQKDSSDSPTGLVEDYCAENPEASECKGLGELTCDNPAIAAVDPTCVDCAANPTHPTCDTRVAATGTPVGQAGVGEFSSTLGDDAMSLDEGLDPSLPGFQEVNHQESMGQGTGIRTGAGGFSGGGGGSGGGANGGGSGAGGYAGSGYDTNVIEGTGGGGGGRGGGGAFNYRYGSGKGDGSPYKALLKKVGAKAAAEKKPDITGPGGPSNFDKITHRYRANRSTLLPE